MMVFVTGASGYIGGSIAARLVAAGHRVTGLTRSPEKAEAAGRTFPSWGQIRTVETRSVTGP